MDESPVDLGEPVSPSSSSSSGSAEEEDIEQSENSGLIEQSVDSASEGRGTPGLSEMHENEQVDPGHIEKQEKAISSEHQGYEENPPRSPDITDKTAQVGVSPQQSSVSEVSSENEEVQSSESFDKERYQGVEEQLRESQWKLDQTRIGSPKEEHLDYGSSDSEDDNLEKSDMDMGSSDINVTSDSSVLGWRKVPLESGEDEGTPVSQTEGENASVKMNIHDKEVDDVSDQSGGELDEDTENNDEDQPLASSDGNRGTDISEVTVTKGEDLDDVSEQSDSEVGQTERGVEELGQNLENEDDEGVQEDLDDVSEQSDVETGEKDPLTLSLETSAILDQERQAVQGQLEEAGEENLDDISDSEDAEAEGEQDQESLPGKSLETSPTETPSKEAHHSQEAVVDVDHHGDELDFEEDVEERDAGEAEEKVPREAGVMSGGEKQETNEDNKLERQDQKERIEEELESGEEGEAEEEKKDEEAGELEDDDAEEGEVKDPEDRKVNARPVCRFFVRGQCTWGTACRFIHPGVNDLGNYSLIDFKEIEENTAKLLNKDMNPPPPPPPEEVPEEDYVMPEPYLPPPPVPEEPARESVWERGIRQAKEMKKRAERRKELGIQDEPQFVVEETFEDFDMEAEFNPDLNRPRENPYGYSVDPEPEYNPRRDQRGHYYESRAPRHEQRRGPRHEPYQEQKYRESRPPPRKDEFGRDYSKRQQSFQERQPPRVDIPKQYPAPKADRGFQDRGRKEERSRTNVVSSAPADAWQDPWARNRSPKPKSKVQSKSRKRSGSLSSGSSVSRSRSRSYSSGSSRSSSASSYSSKSDSRSPSPVSRKPKPTKPLGIQPREKGLLPGRKPGADDGKLGLRKPPGPVDKTPPVKKLGLQPTPQKSARPPRKSMSNSSISSASRSRSRSKSPSRSRPHPGIPPKSGTKARRRRSSSGSSHVSVSSQSSADSDHMYANLASPVSSSSSPERQSKKKAKVGVAKQREKFPPSSKSPKVSESKSGRPKQVVTVPAMEAFREPPVQIKKPSKPSHQKTAVDPKSKSTSAPAQMTSRNPVKHTAHKDIKLTLLNKPPAENKKRYEVMGEGVTKKVKPVAPVKPTTKVVVEKERRPVKPLQQSTKKTTPSAMVAPVRAAAVKPNPSERKRPPSPFNQRDQPPAKVAHKTSTSSGGKVRDPAAAKKATISRREEILKQLKAVEEMIARKKAKMKN